MLIMKISSWLSLSFANTSSSLATADNSVKGESGELLADKSVKGESGESEVISTVSRAKRSFVSEGDDTLHVISYLPGIPTVGGAFRNLELMI